MKKREMVVLTDVSLITAIVQRGMADDLVTAAQEAGAQGASIHYSHGRGVREEHDGEQPVQIDTWRLRLNFKSSLPQFRYEIDINLL